MALSLEVNQVSHAVIGAALEFHKQLGPGFLESVYEEALRQEFFERRIPFNKQLVFAVDYKGVNVGEGRLDFLVADSVVVEIKAVEGLAPIHTAQVISYLKATKKELGLLINFNVPRLKDGIRRIILTEEYQRVNHEGTEKTQRN